MGQQLTPSQQHWFDLAAMHADDFATRAEQHDRENTFPFENYDALKASGYSNMTYPAELGGGGASMLDMCIAQERLARGDAPTAIAINMHFSIGVIAGDVWRESADGAFGSTGRHLENIAKNRLLIFNACSEPGVDSFTSLAGANYSILEAERVEGGFRISGRKAYGTGTLGADLLIGTAMYNDPVEGEVVIAFSFPKDTPGITCQNDWDTLGMRATGSHSWVWDNIFVADDYVTRSKPLVWDGGIRGMIALNSSTFGAVYLGIARAARDFAVEYSKTRVRVPREHPVSYYPSSQFLAAEMDIGLKAAWALQLQVADMLSDRHRRDDDALVEGTAAQYFVTHTAVDVVNKAIELVGGAALAKRLPLERYYRDVRAGPIHPIGGYDALEMIGKHAFGIPIRDSEPRWA